MVEKRETKKVQVKKFFKSRKNRMIDGVCGGLAEYLGADLTLIRILWVISIFLNGLGLIAYVLAMILVPVNPAHKDLKEGEKKRPNTAFILGTILIVLGFLFLYHEWGWTYRWDFPSHFRFFPWWRASWDVLWPLALVALGIVYILHVLRKEKSEDIPDGEGKRRERSSGKKLFRTPTDRMLGGVCGGLGRHFGVDPTLVRIGFAVLALLTHVFLWIVIYVILLVVMPQEEVVEKRSGSKA